jgi:outer membrane receptor protein involved in Fe transport
MAVAAATPSLALAQEGQVSPAAPATPPAAAQAPTQKPPARKAAPEKPPLQTTQAPKTVGEVVVTGQAAAAVQISIDRKSYSVANDLHAETGAITDVLRNLPSVEVDVLGNVSLRGDPNVTILLDGKPSSLFEGDNKGQALQSLQANTIERVEVITSPSAEFRADGSGGVINLITKKAKGAGPTGSLRATVGDGHRYNGGATFGYNSPKLSAVGDINVRHDTVKSEATDDRLLRDPAGGLDAVRTDGLQRLNIDSLQARASVDYDATPRTRIGVESHTNLTHFRVDNPSLFATDDALGDLVDSFAQQTNVNQKRSGGEVSANLRQKLGAEGEFTSSLSYEGIVDQRHRDGHTFDQTPPAPEAFSQQRIDNHLHRVELKGDYTLPLADMAKLKAGFDIDHVDNVYRNRGFAGGSPEGLGPNPALTNLFEFHQTVSAAYVTYERPFGDLTVLAGLRVEDVQLQLDQVTLGQHDENPYLRAYPSLHLNWKLSDSQSLSASYSRRVQRPDPSAFNAFRFMLDPLNFQAGNPDLKPQQTQSFEAGYAYHSGPTSLQATAFYREIRDGVDNVLVDLGGGVTLSERANLAQSRSGGLELNASGKVTKTLSYNLSGTLSWTELDSLGPTFAPTRSLVAFGGHGGVTWQPTAEDLFQLNAFMNPKRLTPQGYFNALVGVDLGYRRKLTDKVSLVVTLQDLLRTFHASGANQTPILLERFASNFDTRAIRVGLTWSFGGGRAKEPVFEFTGGGPGQ